VPPQDEHCVLPSQASPVLHQYTAPASPAGPFPAQQGCPIAPHSTHWPLAHAENGAVQPAPASQHGLPTTPHAPPLQPPAAQLPCPLPHEFPDCTQVPETQHPPRLQSIPSQHG
jgi:hypothetical protein